MTKKKKVGDPVPTPTPNAIAIPIDRVQFDGLGPNGCNGRCYFVWNGELWNFNRDISDCGPPCYCWSPYFAGTYVGQEHEGPCEQYEPSPRGPMFAEEQAGVDPNDPDLDVP